MQRRTILATMALVATTALTAAPAAGSGGEAAPAGESRQKVKVGKLDRRYLLYLPKKGAGEPRPLVITLHGGGGRASRLEAQTGWRALADAEGFVVAYPEGIGRSWNDGRTGTDSAAARQGVDDVAFLAALIDDAAARAAVDPKRVYLNGMSNGAFMTQRAACDLADRIAAIGLVAGTSSHQVLGSCKPRKAVAAIVIHGTADPLVPYLGGKVKVGGKVRGEVASSLDVVSFWVERNTCKLRPERRDLADLDPTDGSTVREELFAPCPGAAEVRFLAVVGGGHTWPGGKQYLPRKTVGPVNRDIDATRELWQFFAAHPRP
jgi:polyhydroxybutyrate depolymerase